MVKRLIQISDEAMMQQGVPNHGKPVQAIVVGDGQVLQEMLGRGRAVGQPDQFDNPILIFLRRLNVAVLA